MTVPAVDRAEHCPRPRGFAAARSRSDVVEHVAQLMLRGRAVDLVCVAAELGVGRRTLYRWFGDRAGLLREALWSATDQAFVRARADASGAGTDHVVDVIRLFLTTISTSVPAVTLLRTEPRLAVLAIMSPTGSAQRRAVARTVQLLGDHTDLDDRLARDAAEVITQVAMSFVWAQVIAGRPADIETALDVTRRLLRSP